MRALNSVFRCPIAPLPCFPCASLPCCPIASLPDVLLLFPVIRLFPSLVSPVLPSPIVSSLPSLVSPVLSSPIVPLLPSLVFPVLLSPVVPMLHPPMLIITYYFNAPILCCPNYFLTPPLFPPWPTIVRSNMSQNPLKIERLIFKIPSIFLKYPRYVSPYFFEF